MIAVEPEPFHGIEGLKNLQTAIVPGIYDPVVHDLKIEVRTEEAYYWTRRLAREEGLFVGQSSGAVMAALMKILPTIREGVVVMIFADGGERYLSTPIWEAREEAFGGKARPTAATPATGDFPFSTWGTSRN